MVGSSWDQVVICFTQGGSYTLQTRNDLERIGYCDLVDEVKKMGYHLNKMYYKVSGVYTMDAMREVKDNKQVLEMINHIKKLDIKVIEVLFEGQQQQESDAFVEQCCKEFEEEAVHGCFSVGGEASGDDPNIERAVKATRNRGGPRKAAGASSAGERQKIQELVEATSNGPIIQTPATGQRKSGRPGKEAGASGGVETTQNEEVGERGVCKGGEADPNDPITQTPATGQRKRGRPRKEAGASGGLETTQNEKVGERGVCKGATGQRKRGRPRKEAGASGGLETTQNEEVGERGVCKGGEAGPNDPMIQTPATGQRKRGRPRKEAGESGAGETTKNEEVGERGFCKGAEADPNDQNIQTPLTASKRGRPRKIPIYETGAILAATGQAPRSKGNVVGVSGAVCVANVLRSGRALQGRVV